jgi:hypothetical protein
MCVAGFEYCRHPLLGQESPFLEREVSHFARSSSQVPNNQPDDGPARSIGTSGPDCGIFIIGPLAFSARALSCARALGNDDGPYFLHRWFLRQFSYWLSRTLSWAGAGREARTLRVKDTCQLCGNCLIGDIEVPRKAP